MRPSTTTLVRHARAFSGPPIRPRSSPTVRQVGLHAPSKAVALSTVPSNAFCPTRRSVCGHVAGGVRCCLLPGDPAKRATAHLRPRQFLCSYPRYRGLATDSTARPEEASEELDSTTSVVPSDAPEPVSIEIPGSQTGGRKLAIVFTCDVCQTRSAKQFTEKSYLHGVVIVWCPGCQNLHLIADRLGYFDGGDWDLNKIAETRGESIRTIKDRDVFETLDLEDLVGREKFLELQEQLNRGEPTPSSSK